MTVDNENETGVDALDTLNHTVRNKILVIESALLEIRKALLKYDEARIAEQCDVPLDPVDSG
jgi:hypothetical protein